MAKVRAGSRSVLVVVDVQVGVMAESAPVVWVRHVAFAGSRAAAP